jgi:hypothetical protein
MGGDVPGLWPSLTHPRHLERKAPTKEKHEDVMKKMAGILSLIPVQTQYNLDS